jgi:two-component system, NarL family, sensor kinase
MDASPPRGIKHLKLRDVIEAIRKKTAAIRLSDENFGAAGDVRGAALGVLSPDGRFILANNSAAAMFGYSTQDLIGKSLVEMAPDADQQTIRDGLSCSASDAFHSFSAILCGRSGRKTVLLHQQAIADTAGRFTVLLTLFEEPVVLPLGALEASTCAEPDSLRRYADLMIGQERERKRVASELHDGLGQALTLIELLVEDSLMRIRRGNVDEATELLDTTVLRIREAIGEVRHICSESRPVLLDRLGLAAALEALCKRVEQGSGNVVVIFDCRVEEEEEIPDRLKADMFRIAQEAMNNAMKHGAATEIRLTVRRVETGVVLAIQDNGIGFDNLPVWTGASSFSGPGLIGMQQRVQLNGGTFLVQSGEGGGTLVSAMWKT